jgi:hypothetical protein
LSSLQPEFFSNLLELQFNCDIQVKRERFISGPEESASTLLRHDQQWGAECRTSCRLIVYQITTTF